MRNYIKKKLVIVPMIFLLCMSFIGTMAQADDKVNGNQTKDAESATLIQNSNNSASATINNIDTNEDKTSVSTKKDKTNLDSSTSDNAVKSTSLNDDAGKSNQESSTGKEGQATVKDTQSTTVTDGISGWQNIGGKLFYVTKDGILKENGWFREIDENPKADDDNEYYLDKDYSAAIGWKKIDGSWYYFDEAGVKQTGWKYIKYDWYHFNDYGEMDTGWIKDKGSTYYFNDEGAMVLNKNYIDDKWYFFGDDGALKKGFYNFNGKMYYSTNDGVMAANQWVDTKKYKYYVKADSSVATGHAIIDGKMEAFDANGKYIEKSEMEKHLFIKQLNVGDADCAFIELPDGETALIDTGTPETSQEVIDFLNSQDLKVEDNKKVIDYIVITHAHSDHIGGLASILDNFKVKKVYMPDIAIMQDWYSNVQVTTESAANVQMMKTDYEVYEDAVKAMKDHNMEFTNTEKGQFIDKENILQFVQSDKNFGPIGTPRIVADYWGINENSAIVYLNYGDLQELFTADMEWNSEKDFWVNDLLNGRSVDVLKVPHHGHDTSSTPDFIKYLSPSIGIISRAKESVEKNIAYKNLTSNGVTIYETSDKDGVSIYATPENWTLGN